MKNILKAIEIVLIVLLIIFISINIYESYNLRKENQQLKTQIIVLENQKIHYPTIDSNIKPKLEIEVPIINKFENVDINILDKINHEKNYDLNIMRDFVELKMSIINNYDKDIKGINGVLHVKDMFNIEIINIDWDLTETNFPIEETIYTDGKGLELLNRTSGSDFKLWNTPYENLVFEYECKQIVFMDNSILK